MLIRPKTEPDIWGNAMAHGDKDNIWGTVPPIDKPFPRTASTTDLIPTHWSKKIVEGAGEIAIQTRNSGRMGGCT